MCLLAWYGKAAQPQNMTFSREKKVFYGNFIFFYTARVIRKKPVISFDFNFQYNREFLRYKALKNYVWTGSIITQKYKILPKRRIKKIHSDFEST